MANTGINLSFLTLNVQGLRNKKRRQALFRSFKLKNIDVIALQETHLTENETDIIRSEWNGIFHMSSDTSRSKGLLTLFNNSISHFESFVAHKSDRIMTSVLKVNNDTSFLITNVYSPSDSIKNRICFFDCLKDTLLPL